MVRKGTQCGIVMDNWQDYQEGDVITAYELVPVDRALGDKLGGGAGGAKAKKAK